MPACGGLRGGGGARDLDRRKQPLSARLRYHLGVFGERPGGSAGRSAPKPVGFRRPTARGMGLRPQLEAKAPRLEMLGLGV